MAKAKVLAHTAQPAREIVRWRACHSRAAQDGMTSAIRSAATPMARKSHRRNRAPGGSGVLGGIGEYGGYGGYGGCGGVGGYGTPPLKAVRITRRYNLILSAIPSAKQLSPMFN